MSVHCRVGSLVPDLGEHWDPHIYCGPGAAVALADGPRLSLRDDLGATCIEGLRTEPISNGDGAAFLPYTGPIFRQANLTPFRFHLDNAHWQAPTVELPECVAPGDVVINKLAPVRAAWATARLPRHPADANCIIIRWAGRDEQLSLFDPGAGLQERRGRAVAFWTALCLNQPAYQEYLLRRSGAAFLPRARMSVLRELKLPPAPPEAEQLAGAVWEWLEQSLANAEELTRLAQHAEEEAAQAGAVDDAQAKDELGRRWWRFFRAAEVSDSLIPRHVTLSHLQYQLRIARGWLPLEELLGPRQPGRKRLTVAEPDRNYLRLGDVGSDLAVTLPAPTDAPPQPGRVYSEPLTADEVLVSLLGTSPRVGFAGADPPPGLFVIDHWERLCFRETPGAWALALDTSPVRRQRALMAMGTAQQFAHPESVRTLVLPPLPLELRLKWDRALRRLISSRKQLESQWQVLWGRSLDLYRAAHAPARRITWAEAKTVPS
jgi:hypothetical protein